MSLKDEMILITGGSGFVGINLSEMLLDKDVKFANIDRNPPIKEDLLRFWKKIDLLDLEGVIKVIEEIRPTIIIHLAARTDTSSNRIDEYIDNTLGTQNLIKAISKVDFIKRLIVTSTQYVYRSLEKPFPQSEETYMPFTAYGESKVITEKLTREANLNCIWTIVRPVNVWGPWHMRYPQELWKIIDKGWYLHPTKKPVIRTYGYVKNVAHQIIQILSSADDIINRKVFYLGDLPIDSLIWLNALSWRMNKVKLRTFPKTFFLLIAKIGDLLRALSIPFPIYSIRFKNMVEDYYAPTNITLRMFGAYETNLEKNVDETIQWLEKEGKSHFNYWQARNR